jgi:hypothetical protein
MMLIRPLFLVSLAASGATLTISPPVITNCTSGLGIATLTWSGATGSPQIRVGQTNGPALSGILGASGSANTGLWVSDGMSFYLVDQTGFLEASATAQVKCGSAVPTVDQGLASGSYFPLAVGNTWVYKYNDRTVTASYVVQSITGQQVMGGQLYYVLSLTSPGPPTTVALLRADSNGVIYQYTSSGDQVYLDPTSAGATSYSGPLGVFNDAIKPPGQLVGSLLLNTSIYARGIGMVSFQSMLETGSSGGFTEGLDLVDVQVNGFHLSVPAPNIVLARKPASRRRVHRPDTPCCSNCSIPGAKRCSRAQRNRHPPRISTISGCRFTPVKTRLHCCRRAVTAWWEA